MELIVFNDDESELIGSFLTKLSELDRIKDIDIINKNINALVELARAISQYPSVFGTEQLGPNARSVESLMEMLCRKEGMDKLMHIPTKAVLGKGFLIAKINFLYLLRYLADDMPDYQEQGQTVLNYLTNTIFMIMCEEVYMGIIDERDIPVDTRNRAAFLLANIWEYRLNQGVQDFAPMLTSLWDARKKLTPVFGTMMGMSEMVAMSELVEGNWLDLLQEDDSDEFYEALEEFLFTMTYEELFQLRRVMGEKKIKVIKREDVTKLIGKNTLYPHFDEADPREMYRFYRDRKTNARFRKRAEVDGPKRTLEEHIMCYLLSSHEWMNNF